MKKFIALWALLMVGLGGLSLTYLHLKKTLSEQVIAENQTLANEWQSINANILSSMQTAQAISENATFILNDEDFMSEFEKNSSQVKSEGSKKKVLMGYADTVNLVVTAETRLNAERLPLNPSREMKAALKEIKADIEVFASQYKSIELLVDDYNESVEKYNKMLFALGKKTSLRQALLSLDVVETMDAE